MSVQRSLWPKGSTAAFDPQRTFGQQLLSSTAETTKQVMDDDEDQHDLEDQIMRYRMMERDVTGWASYTTSLQN